MHVVDACQCVRMRLTDGRITPSTGEARATHTVNRPASTCLACSSMTTLVGRTSIHYCWDALACVRTRSTAPASLESLPDVTSQRLPTKPGRQLQTNPPPGTAWQDAPLAHGFVPHTFEVGAPRSKVSRKCSLKSARKTTEGRFTPSTSEACTARTLKTATVTRLACSSVDTRIACTRVVGHRAFEKIAKGAARVSRLYGVYLLMIRRESQQSLVDRRTRIHRPVLLDIIHR
jgi:hypothetical protein